MSDVETNTGLRVKGRLMSASEIERTLVRLAHEIVEKSNGSSDLALVGIKRRGVPLAERLGKLISGIEKRKVDTGVLDIQFYRDDLTTAGVRPIVTPGSVVAAAVAVAEAELGETGRVLLRPSGTEPMVRVMVEALDQETADRVAQRLADVVKAELAL